MLQLAPVKAAEVAGVLKLELKRRKEEGEGRNQHTSLSFTENSLFSATCLVTFDPCGEAEGSSLTLLLALSSSLVV